MVKLLSFTPFCLNTSKKNEEGMTRQFSEPVVVFFNCRSWGMNEWSLDYWILCCIFRFISVLLPRATIQEWIELCDPLRVLPFIVFSRLREILRGQTSTWQGCQSSEGIPSSWDEFPPGSVDLLFGSYNQERCYAPLDFVLLLYPKHCLNQPGSQGDNIRGSNEYTELKVLSI